MPLICSFFSTQAFGLATSPDINMYPENQIDLADDKWSSSSSTETIPANDQPVSNDSDFDDDEFLDVQDDLYIE